MMIKLGKKVKVKADRHVIEVEDTTREQLRELGTKDESYNDIIKKLLKFYADNKDKA